MCRRVRLCLRRTQHKRKPGFLFASLFHFGTIYDALKGKTMPNARKELQISELREIMASSKGAVLTDYRGLTVAEITNLRRKLRDQNAEYHIVKNTLFKIALGDQLTPGLEELLVGPTAIAFFKDEFTAPTKTVLDFVRDSKKQEVLVKGGFFEGKLYNPEQVTAISKLPSREQLIANVVGSINAPISEFVGTLDGILSSFVRTIQAIADQKAEGAA